MTARSAVYITSYSVWQYFILSNCALDAIVEAYSKPRLKVSRKLYNTTPVCFSPKKNQRRFFRSSGGRRWTRLTYSKGVYTLQNERTGNLFHSSSFRLVGFVRVLMLCSDFVSSWLT